MSEKTPRDIYIFLDGTANDAGSRTNIAKLHNIITLQNDPKIAAIYIDGVGTQTFGRVLGLATGLGNANRVQEAYRFLIENYKEGDNVYLFGFSRGAWSARILASLIYVAGLPDIMHLPADKRKDAVDDIYYTYKKFWGTLFGDNRTLQQRREDVEAYLAKNNLLKNHKTNVNIDFLGLWDTVQALGVVSIDDTDVGEPNKLYADQLCNIRRIAHAVSLDDYRFEEFTPLLFRQLHFTKEDCIGNNENDGNVSEINEVWFSGAHSDVGGGYDDTTIDGVSLNWMLGQMIKAGITSFDHKTEVYANHLDKTHNANIGFLDLVYDDLSRDLATIYESDNYIYPELHLERGKNIKVNKGETCSDGQATQSYCYQAKIKLHASVLDRLCVIAPKHFESHWFRMEPFKECVMCNGNTGSISEAGNCGEIFEVENDARYKPQSELHNQNLCKLSKCELSDTKGRNQNPIKSCNLSLPQTKKQAKQRLSVTTLDGSEPSKTKATVTYFSDRKNDRTGIHLERGVTYKLTLEQINGWSDCTYPSAIDGRGVWDKPSYQTSKIKGFLGGVGQTLAKLYSEYPTQKYTALIGRVNKHSIKFHKVLTGKSNLSGDVRQIGFFSVPESGELILSVNEPRDPDLFGNDYFGNNAGFIEFTVEVVDAQH
ncbi:phospholipase effector Tle1 domain-containing protein [Alteromonas aquimaris]|nr:DUF2235 domain-containing protein [Alteromonas aquimaris]